jgi:hypothetical protein
LFPQEIKPLTQCSQPVSDLKEVVEESFAVELDNVRIMIAAKNDV